MNSLRRIVVATAATVVLPLLALADAPGDVSPENRQRLEKIKAVDPQLTRLRHNWAIWRALPADRQTELRKFDRDLQEEPSGTRARFERILERYADWLERLPDADRKRVHEAPDRKTRLQRIRDIRDRQWLQRLPKGLSDRIAATPPVDRPELIRKLRHDDLEERLDWQVVLRNPGPAVTRLDLLSKDNREYVDKHLLPLLSREEEKQLRDAEGRWPRFPRTLVDMADNHPLPLLGPIGPTSVKDLPPNAFLVNFLEKDKRARERLEEAKGRWPDFGVALREVGKTPFGKKVMASLPPARFTPSRRDDFPPIVQDFITKKLLPVLEKDESSQLEKAEGNWPAFPQTVLELARKHNLVVPAGTPRWDNFDRYRSRPQHTVPPRRGDWPGVGL